MTDDAPQPITTDLLCIACQYNLRTRTLQDRCPECGLPIAQTLDHRKQHAGAILDSRLLRLACYAFAIPSLLSPLYLAGLLVLRHFQRPGFRPLAIAEILLRDLSQIIFIITLIAGVFFFLNSVSKIIVSAQRRSAATMLTITYAMLSILGLMGSFSMLRRGNPRRMFFGLSMMRDQRIGTAFICLLLAIEGYVALRQLSKSLAEPKLAAQSRWVFGAVIADNALSLLIYLLLAIWRPTRDVTQFQGVFDSIDIASAGIFAAFGIYWLAIARTISRQCTKPPPLPEPTPTPPPAVSAQEKIDAFLAHRQAESPR